MVDLVNGDKNLIVFPGEHPYYIPRIKFGLLSNQLLIQTINRHQNHLKLWQWNTQSKEIQLLLEEKDKAYVSIHDNLKILEDQSFLWTSERDGYNHIYHYNAQGNLIRQLTR